MNRRLRVSRGARRDIEALLDWSRERFGEAAAEAYRRLIETAFDDLLDAFDRPGSVLRPVATLAASLASVSAAGISGSAAHELGRRLGSLGQDI